MGVSDNFDARSIIKIIEFDHGTQLYCKQINSNNEPYLYANTTVLSLFLEYFLNIHLHKHTPFLRYMKMSTLLYFYTLAHNSGATILAYY